MKLRIDKNISDIIKMMSAIMIAMHHFSQYICANHISDNIFYKLLSSQGGYLGVALFFFLSGYGLMESEAKKHLYFTEFVKRRFLKIYFPVLLVTVIWLPYCYLGNGSILMIKDWGNHALTFNVFLFDLLFGFKDGVLWFVKVLAILYVAFFGFTLIRQKSEQLSVYFLYLLTILIFIGVSLWLQIYTAISIPMFSLGVLASMNKDRVLVQVNETLISLTIVAILQTALLIFIDSLAMAMHSLVNYVCIALMIYVLSIYKLSAAKIPLIGYISFDLYLVHNKVLMILKSTIFPVPLPYFIVITAIATTLFYLIRTKILKI